MEFENSMNTNPQPAIAEDLETSQVSENENLEETEPQGQEETLEGAAQSPEDGQAVEGDGTASEEKPFLEIKFNKQAKGLTQEEAKNFAEIGMKYQGVRESLERYATLKGITVEELVAGLEKAEDDAYRQEMMEKFDGDEETVNQMMELREIRKQKTLDTALQNQQNELTAQEQRDNERIAEEFLEMKKDFPELTEFDALPNEVKQAAIEGKALSHAYLLFKHRENSKIEAAKKQQETAAKTTAGAIEEKTPIDFVGDAFIKGLNGN